MKFSMFILLLGTLAVSCQFNETGEKKADDKIVNNDTVTVDLNLKVGEELFKENCTSCHSIHEKIIGPPLYYIDTLSRQWVYAWLKNSQQLIKSNDKEANKIFNDFNKIIHPAFNFSESQIDNIVNYISNKRKMDDHSPPWIRNNSH